MKYLDTRDLQKRQEELQEEKDSLENELEEARESYSNLLDTEACDIEEAEQALEGARNALADRVEENQEELDELNNLENEVGSEWPHGETLIPEQNFTEHCQELLADIGDLPVICRGIL